MTHRDNGVEAIRRGLGILVQETPLAPEFDQLETSSLPRQQSPSLGPAAFIYAGAAVLVLIGGIALLVGGEGSGSSEPLVEPATTPETQTQPPTTEAAPESTSTSVFVDESRDFPYLVLDSAEWRIELIAHSEGTVPPGEDTAAPNPGGWVAALEMQWVNGAREAQLNIETGAWADLDALVADRLVGGARIPNETVLGTPAVVIQEGDSHHTALWAIEDDVYELRANLSDDDFRSLLASVTAVEREEWLRHLPDTIVTDRAAAAAEFLRDVPLPDGFDVTTLETGYEEHWYFVAADAVSSVACAWIDQWVEAKADGDRVSMDEAEDAMATSRDWGILIEMEEQGGFSSVVWEYADAIAGDGTVVAGMVLTVEESYENALGCDSP